MKYENEQKHRIRAGHVRFLPSSPIYPPPPPLLPSNVRTSCVLCVCASVPFLFVPHRLFTCISSHLFALYRKYTVGNGFFLGWGARGGFRHFGNVRRNLCWALLLVVLSDDDGRPNTMLCLHISHSQSVCCQPPSASLHFRIV